MHFNSFEFIVFFVPVILFIFYGLGRLKLYGWAKFSLVLASFVFYARWDYRFLVLLAVSISCNYLVGRLIWKNPRKSFVAVGVGLNILLLGYFKYTNFFLASLNSFLGLELASLRIILPLGISFFTFQQISFLVDQYRQQAGYVSFLDYTLFVSFFPKLIAGPIVRYKELIPQLKEKKIYQVNYRNLALGLCLFFLGLFKKVVIADNLVAWASPGFDLAHTLTFLEAWGAAAAYTFQLYFDFSGYSEMAMGLALFFNMALPVNFDSPYKASSIIDFWSRWHMTLSFFLRDYIYIPLGGNRRGQARRYLNLLATMLLGGLWHGAAWTFVFWGGLHGLYLCLNHAWRALGKKFRPQDGGKTSSTLAVHLAAIGSRVATFLAVLVAWVFFRADGFPAALKVIKGMLGMTGVQLSDLTYLPHGRYQLLTLLALFLFVNFAPNTLQVAAKFKPSWPWLLFLVAVCVYAVFSMHTITDFLYFQF